MPVTKRVTPSSSTNIDRYDCKQMLVNKVVFPIAGLETRFLPATKARPEETLWVMRPAAAIPRSKITLT
jgi:hypothetical protein